ncbi:MAG: HugZ family pyridoxamine 5'-phosphate oxidase [Thermoanaerobaculia bacterium]
MTQHASSSPAPTAPEPSYAERVRTLLETESVGTLATQSVRHPGFPFASVMPYALTGDGSPLFLISGMAVHTQNLVADSRASLLVMQSGSGADPLGSPRATLLGSAHRIDEPEESLRQEYLKRHPPARHWIGFSDFSFFRLDVAHIYFVGGFGVMGWVEHSDYASAAPDPLADAAPGIMEHMNRDHTDALRDITRRFGELDALDATIVSCDRLGFVVQERALRAFDFFPDCGQDLDFDEVLRAAGGAYHQDEVVDRGDEHPHAADVHPRCGAREAVVSVRAGRCAENVEVAG